MQYSFSGVFESYKNITTLKSAFSELVSENQKDFWKHDFKPKSLQSAYKLIVEVATESYRVNKYLQQHNISDFNPKRMNVVVMKQIDFEIFGMFLTSSQSNPGEVLIHYQVMDKNADEKKAESEERGGVIAYNKRTQELGDNKLDEQTRNALRQFGEVAGQIERMFGIQQIELGASGGKVYVFQSRDINLTNPADAPRLAYYKTISEELYAIGYGYYNLPVLVIDSLNNTYPGREWQGKWKGEAEKDKYKEELLCFVRENPEYILVIKDAEDIVGEYKNDRFQKSYNFLNLLASKAKVVIRGKNQSAIRHEDWDNVELGGITIIPPEDFDRYGFMGHFVSAHKLSKPRFNYIDNMPSKRNNNVSMQNPGTIATGDFLNVLSNIDGIFVWIDGQNIENIINRTQRNRDSL